MFSFLALISSQSIRIQTATETVFQFYFLSLASANLNFLRAVSSQGLQAQITMSRL